MVEVLKNTSAFYRIFHYPVAGEDLHRLPLHLQKVSFDYLIE